MIVVIGSSQYRKRIEGHVKHLKLTEGYKDVRVPAFDDHKDLDELGICEYNRSLIEEARRVDIIWDNRSPGVIFDFGMAFALHKPIKIIYIEPKTFAGVMRKYEKK